MRNGTSASVGSVKKISRKQKFSVLAAAIAGVFAFRGAQATDYSWDATGTPGVAPAGGTGIWNTSGLNWTADSGTSYVAWPNNVITPDNAILGGTAGTVSLGTSIVAGGITFNSSGYVIDNGGVAANQLQVGTVTVTNATDTATISAGINTAGGLTKIGAGVLLLDGANTYTGDTNIFDGTLRIGANGNINAAGNLSIFFGAFDVQGNSAAANVVAMSAGGSILGTGTLTANAFNLDEGTATANLAGAIATLTKSTSATLTLSGNNTFGGGLVINGGIVSVSSDANLGAVPLVPTSGNITMGGGTLRGTADMTINANRGITMAAGGGTFDVTSGTTTTVNGVIDGPNSMTKSGAGTLALNGANTYSGATTVIGGTLTLAGGGSLNSASNVFISGGAFDIDGTSQTTGAVSLFSGSITGSGGTLTAPSFTVNAGSISAILGGGGGLTKNSASGTVTLTGANTYSGTTLVNLGTLALGAGGSISASSNLTVSGGIFALGANSTSANAVTLNSGSITGVGGGVLTGSSYTVQNGTISAILAGASSPLTKTGTGTVTLTAVNTYGGPTNVNAGTLALGAGANISASDLTVGGGTFDIGANAVSVNSLTLVSGNINGAGTITAPSYLVQSGAIAANLGNNGAALIKNTGGTVTLKGNNGYGGGTTISGGRLAITNNNSLGSGGITLDGGTLQLGETPTLNGLVGKYWVGGQGTPVLPNPTNVGPNINPDYASLAAFSARYGTLTPTLNNIVTTTGGVTQLDFPDTAGNPFQTQGLNFGDQIAAQWTGKIFVPSGGLSTFFTRSDDGSMIFIDGQQVVTNNIYQGETERSGTVDLAAGFHDFVLMFYEGGGNAGLTASWIPPGGSRTVIQNSSVFQTPAGNPVTFGSAYPVNVTSSSGLDLSLSAPG